ncbi:hypothetical protein BH20ACT23_BH20ACT23_26850 [soil metagenome]
MDQTASTSGNGIKAWMSRHFIASIVIAALLAFVVGISSSEAGTDETNRLRGDLKEAQSALRDAEQVASGEMDSLEGEITSLQTQNSELSQSNDDLNEQIMKLNAKRQLPSFIGQMSRSAERVADKYGWDIKIERRFSNARVDMVLEQTPASGTMMRYDASFTIVLAKPLPKVPRIVGISKDKALSQLKSYNWQVTVVGQISTRKTGTVIAISPSGGSSLLPGSAITLTVAEKAPRPPTASAGGGAGCTPGYSPCLPPASDYDCIGGSGDGPEYTGTVTVTGDDPYGLDSDNDGVGCED